MRPESPQPKYTRTLDRYELSHELGRGGMAVVYLARQTDLDRWVALKELHPDGRDASVVKRFLRESRLAGSLSHPNIVTVLDFFEVDGTGYIAMEYVPRGSLRPYVGGLTFAQVAGVLEGVLAGLSCAEREGIVHRDLKPENVMVTADGRVKLADFGIAKATGAASMLTATGTTLGTPHYMAPEQAMGQDVGPWTDLYSVGCMAYELVTGRLPFGDVEAPMAVLLRHINEVPPAACAVAADVDPRLSDWISVLMAKDPAARPQSAADAWDTLEELVLAVVGPRWRRASALPDRGTEQVPGPYTPPPSGAIPADPVFETFHAPPPPAPPVDDEEAREEPASSRRRRTPPSRRAPPDRRASRRRRAPPTPLAAAPPERRRVAGAAAARIVRAGAPPRHASPRRRVPPRRRRRRAAESRHPAPSPRRHAPSSPSPRRRHRGVVVVPRSSPCRSPASSSPPRRSCRAARTAAASARDAHARRHFDAARRRQGPRDAPARVERALAAGRRARASPRARGRARRPRIRRRGAGRHGAALRAPPGAARARARRGRRLARVRAARSPGRVSP